MNITFDPTLKNRLAREILARCQSLQFGVIPWLTLYIEELDAIRRTHGLTLDQLAEMLLEIAYIWRDGATLSRRRLRELIETIGARRSQNFLPNLQTGAASGG
jgi:hypothetical protein